MSKKSRWQPILLTTLALATIPVALIYTDEAISNQPWPEKQEERVVAPRVSVVPVTAGSYQSRMQSFGEVRAVDEINLSSQIAGRVVWRNSAFAVGGRVQKGETLIRIDDTDFKTALANARQALAEAALALQQEQRQQQQAKRDWQRAGISEKPSALVLREPQLKVAKSRHQAAKATLRQAERDLAQTQLKAPFDAVVVSRQVSTGSYLDVGSAVANLRASGHAEVQLALSALQWQQLPADPTGLDVSLHSRDQAGVRWPGRVQRLSNSIDANTRLRSLVVAVDKPLDQPQPLLFGSFVSAEIRGAEVADLFAIPPSALTADGYIWHVVDDHLQRSRRVPAFSSDGNVYVPRGDLPTEIQLLRKPISGYQVGMNVKPAAETQSAQLSFNAGTEGVAR